MKRRKKRKQNEKNRRSEEKKDKTRKQKENNIISEEKKEREIKENAGAGKEKTRQRTRTWKGIWCSRFFLWKIHGIIFRIPVNVRRELGELEIFRRSSSEAS